MIARYTYSGTKYKLYYNILTTCSTEIILCRWDMLTADLELVETIDGYYDVVYGTYEPRYLSWYF